MYDEVIRKIDEVIEAHKRMLRELAEQADAAIGEGDSSFDPTKDYWQIALDAAREGNWDAAWAAVSDRGIKIKDYSGYVPQGAANQSEVTSILERLQDGVISIE